MYAVAAPALLPTRYQSASADAQSDNHALDYLQHWSSLTSATQNSIAAVLDQPYRDVLRHAQMPATRTPTQLPANPDPCDHVGQLLGFATVDECHHDTQHFTISYFLNGTLSWAPDNVTGGFDPSGVPTLIDRYAAALEAAYTVYSSSLGYPTNWTGLVPAEVHSLCGGCGQVLPQGFNAGSPWDTVQTIELSQDVNTAADYLAHHELFHVFQYQYWTFPFRVQLPLHFFEVRWLMESTADWAAGYVTRSGVPGDATAYTQALPTSWGAPRTRSTASMTMPAWSPVRGVDLRRYLVEKLDATTNPGVIKEIWERISANPDNPVAAIDAAAVAHGKSTSAAPGLLEGELPVGLQRCDRQWQLGCRDRLAPAASVRAGPGDPR